MSNGQKKDSSNHFISLSSFLVILYGVVLLVYEINIESTTEYNSASSYLQGLLVSITVLMVIGGVLLPFAKSVPGSAVPTSSGRNLHYSVIRNACRVL